MPKLKTRKAAVKRFKVKKTGKIMRLKAGKKHILEHKTSKVKREMSFSTEIAKADYRRVRKMLYM